MLASLAPRSWAAQSPAPGGVLGAHSRRALDQRSVQGQLTQVSSLRSEKRKALLTGEMGIRTNMLADILLFWVVGVPAAVVTATGLGAWRHERKRARRRTSLSAHDSVVLLSQSCRGPVVHDRRSAALVRSRRPECLNQIVGLRNP